MTTRHRQLPQHMYELMHSLLYWAAPACCKPPRPHFVPAPNFRKGARLFDNYIVFNLFPPGPQPFRAWVRGVDGMAGEYNTPGLPDITGGFSHMTYSSSFGAFSSVYNGAGGLQSGGSGSSLSTSFQAAHSNTIYGASATVMPPSINAPVILYLGKPK